MVRSKAGTFQRWMECYQHPQWIDLTPPTVPTGDSLIVESMIALCKYLLDPRVFAASKRALKAEGRRMCICIEG